MSSYNPNIPAAGTRIDQTYNLITQNFQEINQQYGTQGDHIPFTASTDQGQHKQVTFSAPITALPFTQNGQNSWVYERMLGGAATQSFLEYQSSGVVGNTVIPLSFKAWGNLLITGATTFTVNGQFNLKIGPGGTSVSSNVFSIVFLEPMLSATYMVFAQKAGVAAPSGTSVFNQTANGFDCGLGGPGILYFGVL